MKIWIFLNIVLHIFLTIPCKKGKKSYKCPLWASGEWLVINFCRGFWRFLFNGGKTLYSFWKESAFYIVNPESLLPKSKWEKYFIAKQNFQMKFLLILLMTFSTRVCVFAYKRDVLYIDFHRPRIRKQSNHVTGNDYFQTGVVCGWLQPRVYRINKWYKKLIYIGLEFGELEVILPKPLIMIISSLSLKLLIY